MNNLQLTNYETIRTIRNYQSTYPYGHKVEMVSTKLRKDLALQRFMYVK